ncbi:hypothetical protein GMMP15_880014 [Candidatus Magnetomoraceae bacterium gMMP-15]
MNIQFVIDNTGKKTAVQIPLDWWQLIESKLCLSDEIDDLETALMRLNDSKSKWIDHEDLKRELKLAD